MPEKLQSHEFKPMSEMSDAELGERDKDYQEKKLRLYEKSALEPLTPEECRSLDTLKTLALMTQGETAQRMSKEFLSLSLEEIMQKQEELVTRYQEAFAKGDLDECDKLDTEGKALEIAGLKKSNERLMEQYQESKKKK